VKDHVRLHGQEWETGIQMNGTPVPNWWTEEIIQAEFHGG
jgi:hypothetical protein